MAQLFSKKDDFINQVSMLETLIKEAGHECIFLPKFHCGLNPIEIVCYFDFLHGPSTNIVISVQKKTFVDAKQVTVTSFGNLSILLIGGLWMLIKFCSLEEQPCGQFTSKKVIVPSPRVQWCILMPLSTKLSYIKYHWFSQKIWPFEQ